MNPLTRSGSVLLALGFLYGIIGPIHQQYSRVESLCQSSTAMIVIPFRRTKCPCAT